MIRLNKLPQHTVEETEYVLRIPLEAIRRHQRAPSYQALLRRGLEDVLRIGYASRFRVEVDEGVCYRRDVVESLVGNPSVNLPAEIEIPQDAASFENRDEGHRIRIEAFFLHATEELESERCFSGLNVPGDDAVPRDDTPLLDPLEDSESIFHDAALGVHVDERVGDGEAMLDPVFVLGDARTGPQSCEDRHPVRIAALVSHPGVHRHGELAVAVVSVAEDDRVPGDDVVMLPPIEDPASIRHAAASPVHVDERALDEGIRLGSGLDRSEMDRSAPSQALRLEQQSVDELPVFRLGHRRAGSESGEEGDAIRRAAGSLHPGVEIPGGAAVAGLGVAEDESGPGDDGRGLDAVEDMASFGKASAFGIHVDQGVGDEGRRGEIAAGGDVVVDDPTGFQVSVGGTDLESREDDSDARSLAMAVESLEFLQSL